MINPRKIRITKARDRDLHTALSLDDYMYEKFRRQQQEIHRQHDLYIRRPRRLCRVLEKQKNGMYLKRQIIKVNVSMDGTEVIIQ